MGDDDDAVVVVFSDIRATRCSISETGMVDGYETILCSVSKRDERRVSFLIEGSVNAEKSGNGGTETPFYPLRAQPRQSPQRSALE